MSSTAHVDAVGYRLRSLKLKVATGYPIGGIVSEPVKNERMVPKPTPPSSPVPKAMLINNYDDNTLKLTFIHVFQKKDKCSFF